LFAPCPGGVAAAPEPVLVFVGLNPFAPPAGVVLSTLPASDFAPEVAVLPLLVVLPEGPTPVPLLPPATPGVPPVAALPAAPIFPAANADTPVPATAIATIIARSETLMLSSSQSFSTACVARVVERT
jgi:hypothetical protein